MITNPFGLLTRFGDKTGALGWLSQRQWHRSLLGILGPGILLLSLYPWFQYAWSSYATYTGIGLMLAVSAWDLVSPANRRCTEERCAIPARGDRP